MTTQDIATRMLARYTAEMTTLGFPRDEIMIALKVGYDVLKVMDKVDKDSAVDVLDAMFKGMGFKLISDTIFQDTTKGVCIPGSDGKCLLCGKTSCTSEAPR